MQAAVEQVLQATNPWLRDPDSWLETWSSLCPDPFVPRSNADWPGAFPSDKASLVIGPRQSGKSTFLWSQLRDLGPRVLLVNCEEPSLAGWCRSPALVWADIQQLLPRPAALLFEEVQRLEEAGLFLKGLVDRKPGCPILATGSSSFHLMARTRESLAGRARRLRLLPFSLAETGFDLAGRAPAMRRLHQRERFARMLINGSYPEAWLSPDPERVLVGLLEGVVVKDASDLFRIDRPEAYRKLLRLMASQVGNLVNLSEWAAHCGLSIPTVKRYAAILEEAQVIQLLRPWVSGKRAELTGRPKVYFYDNGIRNAVLARYQPADRREDIGPLWENWVFSEIQKAIRPLLDGCGFWRTRSGAEVDFVVEAGGRLSAIEVKAGSAGRLRLGRAARSFIAAARPEQFITVHDGPPAEREVQGCRCRWIAPTELGAVLAGG